MDILYKSKCQKCGGTISNLQNDDRLKKVFEKMAKSVYEGDIDSGQLDPDFFLKLGDEFMNGLNEGYPIDIVNTPYNSADLVARQQLMNNIYAFSGAKTFNQLTELRNALVNEKGELVSFSDFKKVAQGINEQYNINWLQTEYNNAVNSSISAANWQRFIQDKDLYPYLIYETIGDSNVRQEHQDMDGIKLPIEDPFWDTYYPPNDWGCRCDVSSSDNDNDLTEKDEAKERSSGAIRNKMFKNNPGKTGEIFKDAHPYFKGAPKNLQALKAVDHYGLRSVDKIYERANDFKKRATPFNTKEAFKDWWKTQSQSSDVKDLFGVKNNEINNIITFNKKLKSTLLEGQKWKITQDVLTTLKSPDEVYSSTTKNNLKTTYIKFFNDQPVLVETQINKRLNITEISLIRLLTISPGAELLRRGLLMYKSY